MEATVERHGKFSALCIDDDEAVHELLSLYLVEECEVEWAPDGKTSLTMASGKLYDVVFLDINLGRDTLDGLQLLRLLRGIPAYDKVPVIALTAFAMLGDKEEFLEAGCDHYLSKPFNRVGLMQVLSKIRTI